MPIEGKLFSLNGRKGRQQLENTGLVGSSLPPQVQHKGNKAVVADVLGVIQQLVDSFLGVVRKGDSVSHGGENLRRAKI